MNERIAKQYNQIQKDLSPSEKYAISKDFLNKNSLVDDVGQYLFDNIRKSFSNVDSQVIDLVASTILSSQRKYIAAFRGAACCAQYMASKLVFLTNNIIPLIHADANAIEQLVDITEQDCLVLYSFPRYSRINYALLDLAKSRGAKSILITDRLTSPLAHKADVVLVAHVAGLGFTNSYVVPLALSEVILLAISSQGDGVHTDRFKTIDAMIDKEELY